MELKDIKGFGKSRIETLKEKGIISALDLIKIIPSKYLDYSCVDGVDKSVETIQTIKVRVFGVPKCAYFRGKSSVTVKVEDVNDGITFTAIWYNQPYMKNNLHEDDVCFFTGKFNSKHQFVVQTAERVERLENSIVPLYGSRSIIGNKVIISAIKQILSSGENFSVLDNEIEIKNNLMNLTQAFSILHFPTNIAELELARERIDLEDLLLLASLEAKKNNNKTKKCREYDTSHIDKFIDSLPYKLTDDQKYAIDEILSDLKTPEVMNRMVLGDVGSGKTIVAFAVTFVAIKSGFQSVLLCPTEILAKQHFESATRIFSKLGISVALLHSKLNASEKREIIRKVESGEIDFLVSTHTVLSDKINFSRLGLVITDEQHRFGVLERGGLEKKGESPDVLVMSATPIPRSLSLVLFGDLSVSEIKSRPHGESKIKTNIVPLIKDKNMWQFLKVEIEENDGKVFVVVPRISDDASSNLKSIKEIETNLVNYGIEKSLIASVHGKTQGEEATRIINNFKDGKIKVLVSTTVVEVGIDIPTANLMVVYNAERFGLATLHQLRGRVGRDGREGYCFAVTDTDSEVSKKRLEVFKKHNSGIRLAEEDLKIRGAGTVYGTKQHGASELFLNINFNIDNYNKAKKIISELNQTKIEEISKIAELRFGKIYENVVLN